MVSTSIACDRKRPLAGTAPGGGTTNQAPRKWNNSKKSRRRQNPRRGAEIHENDSSFRFGKLYADWYHADGSARVTTHRLVIELLWHHLHKVKDPAAIGSLVAQFRAFQAARRDGADNNDTTNNDHDDGARGARPHPTLMTRAPRDAPQCERVECCRERTTFICDLRRWRHWRLAFAFYPEFTMRIALHASLVADAAATAAVAPIVQLAESSRAALSKGITYRLSAADQSAIAGNSGRIVFESSLPAVFAHRYWRMFSDRASFSHLEQTTGSYAARARAAREGSSLVSRQHADWQSIPWAERLVLDSRSLPRLQRGERIDDPVWNFVRYRLQIEAERRRLGTSQLPERFADLVAALRAEWDSLHPLTQTAFFNLRQVKSVFPEFVGFRASDVEHYQRDYVYGLEASARDEQQRQQQARDAIADSGAHLRALLTRSGDGTGEMQTPLLAGWGVHHHGGRRRLVLGQDGVGLSRRQRVLDAMERISAGHRVTA